MNKSSLPGTATGIILLIVVLLNILALRETYSGKMQWEWVHLITWALLIYSILKHHHRSKQKKRG